MGPKVTYPILMVCLLAVCTAGAQDHNGSKLPGDFHTRDDGARQLYSVSAFAHGHRHGYEEGYWTADIEIHVGHLRRELRDKDVPKPKDYKTIYGDKTIFRQGFIYGFVAGYRDSFAERSFRLPDWSLDLPPFGWMATIARLPQAEGASPLDAKVRAGFEQGIAEGYKSGLSALVESVQPAALATEAASICKAQPQAKVDRDGFCDGFSQGFLLGVNDSPGPAKPDQPALAKNQPTPQ
ncbi:MAG TPA: hypothetical protein VMZ25_07480 [Terriglobales bacterium]|nr:hypothetical protein [Terriglobales bacterium]